MKHPFLLWSILFISCIILTGCTTTQTEKTKFIGPWEGTYSWAGNFTRRVPATISFYSNGTYLAILPLIHDAGTWDVVNGNLMKTTGNKTVAYTYSFLKNDTALTLTSAPANDLWNLTRQ
jgi:hypothetical protein